MRIPDIFVEKTQFLDSFSTLIPRHYTFRTHFYYKRSPDPRMMGLMIGQIGENWEIYLNGRLLRSELHLDERGRIEAYRANRMVLVELPLAFLNDGENLLVFHIVGSPASPLTGLANGDPMIVDRYENLVGTQRDEGQIVLAAIYTLIGAFHIILFLRLPALRYNLFFGLFALFFGGFTICVSKEIGSWIQDSSLVARLTLVALCAGAPSVAAFLDSLISERITWPIRIFLLVCALIAGAAMILPPSSLDNLGFAFTASEILPVITVLARLPIHVVRSISSAYSAEPNEHRKVIPAIRQVMVGTIAGNAILGFLTVLSTVVYDTVNLAVFHLESHVTTYAVTLFMIGMGINLSQRFLDIQKIGTMYREILDLLPDLVALVRDEKINFINQAGCKVLAQSASEALIGQSIVGFFAEEDRGPLLEGLNGSLKGRSSFLPGARIQQSNSEILAEVFVAPAFNDGRAVSQVFIRDVTERQRAEVTLHQTHLLMIGETERRLSAEAELAVSREREAIFADIHDHLGSRLTDTELMLREARAAQDLAPDFLGAVQDKLEGIHASLRSRVSEIEDWRMLQSNFLGGLRLTFYRRFGQVGRRLHIHADEKVTTLLEGALETALCREFMAILTEIATNDLKYGLDASRWIFSSHDGIASMVFENTVASHFPKKTDGNGLRNLRRRVEFLRGRIEIQHDSERFCANIQVPLESWIAIGRDGAEQDDGRPN